MPTTLAYPLRLHPSRVIEKPMLEQEHRGIDGVDDLSVSPSTCCCIVICIYFGSADRFSHLAVRRAGRPVWQRGTSLSIIALTIKRVPPMSSVAQKAIKHKVDLLNWANEPGNVARACKGPFAHASAGAVRMCGTHNLATAFPVIGRMQPVAGDR